MILRPFTPGHHPRCPSPRGGRRTGASGVAPCIRSAVISSEPGGMHQGSGRACLDQVDGHMPRRTGGAPQARQHCPRCVSPRERTDRLVDRPRPETGGPPSQGAGAANTRQRGTCPAAHTTAPRGGWGRPGHSGPALGRAPTAVQAWHCGRKSGDSPVLVQGARSTGPP